MLNLWNNYKCYAHARVLGRKKNSCYYFQVEIWVNEVLTLSANLQENTVKIINFIIVECRFQLH